MLSRRTLLAVSAALPLAACATTPTLSQMATDAQTVASGLAAALPSIAAIADINPITLTTLQGTIADVQSAAGTIATTTGAPATAVQMLVQAVNAAVAVVTKPPISALIPAAIETIFLAAAALLPSIEAAAGLSSATATPSAMPPDAARLILKAAAGG